MRPLALLLLLETAADAADCANGVHDWAETDVDCGGWLCAGCAVGQGCGWFGDCLSAYCDDAGVCRAATCANGVRDGLETDADCGGDECVPCADGLGCSAPADCASGVCDGAACLAPTCADGVLNQEETDVDCGSSACDACADGLGCAADDDCDSGSCADGLCAGCADGRDTGFGGELGVDCAGACLPTQCADGEGCEADGDCQSGACTDGGVCTSCSDGARTGDEGDVDCGGSACNATCADLQTCWLDTDCASLVCDDGVCASCNDSVANQGESDVDCGAACPQRLCAAGALCFADEDCEAGNCGDVCGDCANGVRDGRETDVDCGGAGLQPCARCATGAACLADGDCAGGVCHEGVCADCHDGVRNGDETDADCGGSHCALRCAVGRECAGDGDCAASLCLDTPWSPVCANCTNGVRDGAEPDTDCGGPCADSWCRAAQGCHVGPDCTTGYCRNHTTCGEPPEVVLAVDRWLETGEGSVSAALGDVDGDGEPDVVLGSRDRLWVLGSGSIATSGSYWRPALGDVDGDGDLDLLAGRRGGLFLFENDGWGAFSPTATTTPLDGYASDERVSPALADLDGDGDLDAVVATDAGRLDVALLSHAGGAFVLAVNDSHPLRLQQGLAATGVALCDMDGDGDADVVLGNAWGSFSFFENVGAATAPIFHLSPPNTFNPFLGRALAAGDSSVGCNATTLLLGDAQGALWAAGFADCNDGLQTPLAETDVDCGGWCASVRRCGLHRGCAVDDDCTTRDCFRGRCVRAAGRGAAFVLAISLVAGFCVVLAAAWGQFAYLHAAGRKDSPYALDKPTALLGLVSTCVNWSFVFLIARLSPSLAALAAAVYAPGQAAVLWLRRHALRTFARAPRAGVCWGWGLAVAGLADLETLRFQPWALELFEDRALHAFPNAHVLALTAVPVLVRDLPFVVFLLWFRASVADTYELRLALGTSLASLVLKGVEKVCFDGFNTSRPLYRCRHCKLETHADCYRPHEPGYRAFTCTLCLNGEDDAPACALCGLDGNRAMRRTDGPDDEWVHETCARYVPGLARADGESEEDGQLVTGVGALMAPILEAPRRRRRCGVCNGRDGFLLGCAVGTCAAVAHALCAKAFVPADDDEYLLLDDAQEIVAAGGPCFCPAHSRACASCDTVNATQPTVDCQNCSARYHQPCATPAVRGSISRWLCAACHPDDSAEPPRAAGKGKGKRTRAQAKAEAVTPPRRRVSRRRPTPARSKDLEPAWTPRPKPKGHKMPRSPHELRVPATNAAVCGVCLLGEGADPAARRTLPPLIDCGTCHVNVHAECFPPAAGHARRRSKRGGKQQKESTFVCPLCASRASTIECALCPVNDNRAMMAERPDKKNSRWVHIACLVWIPEVFTTDALTVPDVKDINKALRTRAALPPCERCGQGGAVLQCSEGPCKLTFHPLCALGLDHYANLGEHVMFCRRHSLDHPCEVCGSPDDAATMLLCEDCNNGFHMGCLSPPLTTVPSDEWFCDACAARRVADGTLVDVEQLQRGAAAPGEFRYRLLNADMLRQLPRPAALLDSDLSSSDESDESDEFSAEEEEEEEFDERAVEDFAGPDDGRRHRKTEFTARNRGATAYFQGARKGGGGRRRKVRKAQAASLGVRFPGHADVVESLGSAAASSHLAQTQLLRAAYEAQFPRWRCRLLNGCSVLLYGFGSKRAVLSAFARTLTDAPVLEVHGFSPGATAKALTSHILCEVIEHDDGAAGSLATQVAAVRDYYSHLGRNPPRLYLVIHNIDGPELRGPVAQHALSELAAAPNVHLVASVDHVNAPLMWQQRHLAAFNWAWHDVTTYAPYTDEAIYEAPALGAAKEYAAVGITHVLRSFTGNHRSVLALLARHQLDSASNHGLERQELLAKCREEMLAHSDVQLRGFLIELQDHALVAVRRAADGREYLHVPHQDETLQLIIDKAG